MVVVEEAEREGKYNDNKNNNNVYLDCIISE